MKKKYNVRKEGISKLKGEAKYIDDFKLKNGLYGATVRSPESRGTLKKFTSQINLIGMILSLLPLKTFQEKIISV